METSVIRQIHRLRQMTVGELQLEWMKVYGQPTRSRNKAFLWKRLAWRVQELQHGGLSDHARQRVRELAPGGFERARTPDWAVPEDDPAPEPAKPPRRDPRLPAVGTVIVREYRGRRLRLTALDSGFELDGVVYASLSEAARAVTGARWSGPLFWGLRSRKRKN